MAFDEGWNGFFSYCNKIANEYESRYAKSLLGFPVSIDEDGKELAIFVSSQSKEVLDKFPFLKDHFNEENVPLVVGIYVMGHINRMRDIYTKLRADIISRRHER